MTINSNKLKAEINRLAAISVRFFTAAGYGGISLETPDSSLGTVTAFEVVPFDTDTITEPRGITQESASDGIRFNEKGIWSVNVLLSISHDEVNAGREFDVQFYDDTAGVGVVTVPVGIGRNVGVTNWSGTFLAEVPEAVIDDLFQIRIGNGDTLLLVTIEYASFSASHVSELQEQFV